METGGQLRNRSVSLVLGSGGARGLAHIGVIHYLDEHGYDIQSISGSSIGSLVGGVYAAGKLDILEEWMRAITRLELVTYFDLAWKRDGILKGDRVINILKQLIGDEQIEDLRIPFTAVAYDINREKEIWLQSGSLFDAIRASSAIPFVLTPHTMADGTVLVDGGLVNPVPIAPTFRDKTDLTIAVDLSGPRHSAPPRSEQSQERSAARTALSQRIKEFLYAIQSKNPTRADRGISPYTVYYQSLEALQRQATRLKLAAYPPDLVIEIPRNACGTMEFYRAGEMIELGHKIAANALAVVADSP